MQPQSLTLTGTPAQLKSALAAFASTDEESPAQDSSSTASTSSKSAGKSGKPSVKQTVRAKQSNDFDDADPEIEASSDDEPDLDEALGLDEEEERNYSLEEVQKLMGKYAKAKTTAAANKILTRFKVKKLSQLPQAKLNEVAKLITL